ncbi:MAG: hypothetical protein ACUVTD_05235, partial [Nitrososphaerales archaeon]
FCRRCGNPLDIQVAFETEKLEELLIDFFKALGKMFPQAKEEFVKIAKEKGLLEIFEKKGKDKKSKDKED